MTQYTRMMSWLLSQINAAAHRGKEDTERNCHEMLVKNVVIENVVEEVRKLGMLRQIYTMTSKLRGDLCPDTLVTLQDIDMFIQVADLFEKGNLPDCLDNLIKLYKHSTWAAFKANRAVITATTPAPPESEEELYEKAEAEASAASAIPEENSENADRREDDKPAV